MCDRGDSCKFSHNKAQDVPLCKHCGKRGHVLDNCWEKYPDKKPQKGALRNRKPLARPNQRPVKGNGLVMQIVQEAVDNNRESVDLAVLIAALKERPAVTTCVAELVVSWSNKPYLQGSKPC